MTALLDIRDLSVTFPGVPDPILAVRGVSLSVNRGETLGIVGESGSGKSVTVLAALGLLPPTATVTGSVRLEGRELLGLADRPLSAIRGDRVAMVFQDPLTAFTPVYTIGDQIAEAVRIHRRLDRAAAHTRAVDLLALVGIPDAERRARSYPHEYSGGMRQRAMIAMAIANDPDVLLADEPTTALDVTIQAQILDVLRTAQRETGAALVFVSHDLGVIAGIADRVAVMYAGRVVEQAEVAEFFARPRMPYSLGLLGAVPRSDRGGRDALVPIPGTPPRLTAHNEGCPFAARCPLVAEHCRIAEPELTAIAADHAVACHRVDEVIARGGTPDAIFPVPVLPEPAPRTAEPATVLEVRGLERTFVRRRQLLSRRPTTRIAAVTGADLDLLEGETLGLVGESGSGKSTLLHEILGLNPPEAGELRVLGTAIDAHTPRPVIAGLRQRLTMVFQDPMSSLDPRMPVHDILTEPLGAHGTAAAEASARVPELLELVGLPRASAARYPHEFSGGQRQRISIARAIATQPRLLVLDEPVSALDVSVQAGVLNLLVELRDRLGLSYLFVSHDLSVIRHIADRVGVMYLGRIVETGPVAELFAHPLHPYTAALLSAVPIPDPAIERSRDRILLHGDPPSPTIRDEGCRFRSRCPVFADLPEAARARCIEQRPASRILDDPARTSAEPGDALPVRTHSVACHWPLPGGTGAVSTGDTAEPRSEDRG